MIKRLFLFGFFATLAIGVPLAVGLVWGYFYISRDLPRLETIDDYQPTATSRLYAEDGTLVGEFFSEEGRRYPAKLAEVPPFVRNAFLAAEDASFYHHPGVDLVSILRAVVKNTLSGKARQGGSTITQQVVKNLLLSKEKKLSRKLKEAILSYQLEKRLSKDDILEIYLNEIFFGNRAYGIKAAARLYFEKELSQLTLGEAAMLAGLPQAPSRYSPIAHMKEAKARQRYVLGQMVQAGFVTQKAAEEAEKEEIRIARASGQNFFQAPYYLSEVRRLLGERWPELRPEFDGLKITVAVDVEANKFGERALRRGLREVDKRRGWRGPLGDLKSGGLEAFLKEYSNALTEPPQQGAIYPALVEQIDSQGIARVVLGRTAAGEPIEGAVDLKVSEWARKIRAEDDKVRFGKPQELVHKGVVIEVALADDAGKPGEPGVAPALRLAQTPEVEGALVLLDPHSGKVRATIGGYDFARNQFNRVTQSLRQPGSSFKPVVYLAAIDGFGYTASTIVYDTPRTFRVGNSVWTPGNFDQSFLGPITLRTALQKSRNLVSADIISRIGIDAAIRYARKLGIKSELGNNLSLSLGSSEVTMLEISRSYGVFASGGMLYDSVFVTKIEDRDGRALYDYDLDPAKAGTRVISAESAFVMAHLMKGVVEHGTGYKVKELKVPVAGKTGTSNDQMDAWFIGYTPEWVCGVWVGFDEKRSIGPKETGGVVSAPIFVYFMSDFLKMHEERLKQVTPPDVVPTALTTGPVPVPAAQQTPGSQETAVPRDSSGDRTEAAKPARPPDFQPPEGVVPYWVDPRTGAKMGEGSPGAILEYYIPGSEPQATQSEDETSSYLESVEL